jgi:hypothetical protein
MFISVHSLNIHVGTLISIPENKLTYTTPQNALYQSMTNRLIKELNKNSAYTKQKRQLCTFDTLCYNNEQQYIHDKASIVIEQFTAIKDTFRFMYSDESGKYRFIHECGKYRFINVS